MSSGTPRASVVTPSPRRLSFRDDATSSGRGSTPTRPKSGSSLSLKRSRNNRPMTVSPRNDKTRTPARPLTASVGPRRSTPRSRRPATARIIRGKPFGDALSKDVEYHGSLTGSLISRGVRERQDHGRATSKAHREYRKYARIGSDLEPYVYRASGRFSPPPGHRNPKIAQNSDTLHHLANKYHDSKQGKALVRRANTASGSRKKTGEKSKRYARPGMRSIKDMVDILHDSIHMHGEDAVPVLEQLTFANPDARRVAIEALIPEELSRTELTNVEHWISHNQKRIRMIKNALLEQRRARLAPDLSSSPRAMTPGQHRRRPRTRAFTKVWDDREKEKRPKTATEKRLSKIQVQSTRQRVERQRKPLSARDIFEWLENKDTHQPQNYMNHDKQRTNSWHIPGKETALYISEKERLQTTNKTGTSLSMRPVYKYIHPQELGHTNNFTRLRNYRKFSNGLHETMRRKQNEYHKPKHPQPKFKRMQAGATYRQGQTRNLTGHFIRETGSERYKNMPSDNIVYKR